VASASSCLPSSWASVTLPGSAWPTRHISHLSRMKESRSWQGRRWERACMMPHQNRWPGAKRAGDNRSNNNHKSSGLTIRPRTSWPPRGGHTRFLGLKGTPINRDPSRDSSPTVRHTLSISSIP
jgi:hypothetical protein